MKTNMTRILFLLVLIISTVLVSCAEHDKPEQHYQLELEKGISHGYPGMILGIKKDGKTWIGADGHSNIEEHIKMKLDDRFHLASVTKIFTAVATLQLIDNGKLHFSDKAKAYLDTSLVNPIPNIDQIEIRQLLDHSSGIYSFNNDLEYIETLVGKRAFEGVRWSNKQLISLAYRERVEPLGATGSGHFYSDTNYILLGLIIEKVSGKSFRQYIQENILDPLDLNNTGFYNDIKNENNFERIPTVQGYMKLSEDLTSFIQLHPDFKKVSNELINTTIAAERIDAGAGMVSTAEDLITFGSALYHGSLLSSKSLNWLLSIGKDIEKEKINTRRQAIVTVRNKPYGVLYTSLGDGGGGMNTMLAYHPESKAIIVAFTNIFGNFDEHDYFMDTIIPSFLNSPK